MDSIVNTFLRYDNQIYKERCSNEHGFSPSLNLTLIKCKKLNKVGYDSENLGYHNRGEFFIYQIKDTLKYFIFNDFFEYIEVEDDRDTTLMLNRITTLVSRIESEVDIETLKPKYIFLIRESTDSTLVYKALNPLENFTNPDSKENPKMKLIEQYFYFSIREKYKIE